MRQTFTEQNGLFHVDMCFFLEKHSDFHRPKLGTEKYEHRGRHCRTGSLVCNNWFQINVYNPMAPSYDDSMDSESKSDDSHQGCQ